MTNQPAQDARSATPADSTGDPTPTAPLVRALIALQLLALALFLGGLVGALVYQDEIREGFRATIQRDLARSLAGRIAFAEEAIATPLAAKHLAPHQIDGIRAEIALYRADPQAYVGYLAGGGTTPLDPRGTLEARRGNPLERAFLERIIGWRAAVKNRFESSFARIGRDIAVFLASNVVAAAAALVLATRVRRRDPRALKLSVLLTAAIVLSALSYLDRNWLYAFLRNDWAVFGYPLLLATSFLWLWMTFRTREA